MRVLGFRLAGPAVNFGEMEGIKPDGQCYDWNLCRGATFILTTPTRRVPGPKISQLLEV